MGRLIPVARCGQPLHVRKVCARIEPCTRTFHRRDRGVARRIADHSTFGRVGTRGSLVPWQRRLGVGRQVGDCAPIPSVDCHRNSRLRCMSALQERHHRLCTAGRTLLYQHVTPQPAGAGPPAGRAPGFRFPNSRSPPRAGSTAGGTVGSRSASQWAEQGIRVWSSLRERTSMKKQIVVVR